MTEFEINEQVAQRLLLDWNVSTDICGEYVVLVGGELFDPCNNPAQAWDIIYNHDISITRFANTAVAIRGLDSRYDHFDTENLCCETEIVINEKPLVAAMLLFLEI